MNDKMIPQADPDDPDVRLLRAVYGLCPECDVPDPHQHLLCHQCNHPIRNADGSYHVHRASVDELGSMVTEVVGRLTGDERFEVTKRDPGRIELTDTRTGFCIAISY